VPIVAVVYVLLFSKEKKNIKMNIYNEGYDIIEQVVRIKSVLMIDE
jgi:hypothetical protein